MPEFENLNQQRQAQPVQIQHEPIRAHLTTLQTWNVAEGQTLEQRRAEKAEQSMQIQREEHLRLQAQVQRQLPPVEADHAAAGQPEQIQQPAQLTYKQRQEQKRRLKEAQKANPAADLDSYTAVHALKHYAAGQDNSMNTPGIYEQAEANHVDRRVLRTFCNGYQKNWRKRPLTPEDEAKKQADERFLNDYVSADLQRRTPHLNRMVNELLTARVTDEMFTDAYLIQHTTEMKQLIDRMVYFQNVYNDPVNAPYFEAMDPLTRTLLETRILNRYAAMGQGFTTLMGAKAVMSDHATYVNGDIGAYVGLAQPIRQILHQTLEETAQQEKDAIQATLQEKMDAVKVDLMQESDFLKQQKEIEQNGEEGLNLTGFAIGYNIPLMAEYRKKIEDNPERYRANQAAVDVLYQELYRNVDARGDLNLESMAVQAVLQDYADARRVADKALFWAANDKQDEIAEKTQLLNNEISSIADALEHLVRNKSLSAPGARLLDRLGLR